MAKTWPQPPSFLQKIPLGCVLERSLGKVVEVVPRIEDSWEGLKVEDVPVWVMTPELRPAIVTIISHSGGDCGNSGN